MNSKMNEYNEMISLEEKMGNRFKIIAENQKQKIEEIVGVKILDDTGWSLTWSSPRGIYDYKRVISFNHVILQGKMYELCKFLSTNECPGWTGVLSVSTIDDKNQKESCSFHTTWDSTD